MHPADGGEVVFGFYPETTDELQSIEVNGKQGGGGRAEVEVGQLLVKLEFLVGTAGFVDAYGRGHEGGSVAQVTLGAGYFGVGHRE